MRRLLRSAPAIAAVGLVAALAACSQTDSQDLRTSGISPSITVAAGDDGLDVSVRLGAGGLNSVDLTGSDSLTATVGGTTRSLARQDVLGVILYGARLDTDGPASPGTKVTVALKRGSSDASAPASTVRIPSRLTITKPSDGAKQRRSSDLVVRTNAGDGRLEAAWEGSCVRSGSLSVGEGKPLVIPAGRMRDAPTPSPSDSSSSDAPPPKDCTVTLTVRRIVTGELDDHYKGGVIEAVRSASVALSSVP